MDLDHGLDDLAGDVTARVSTTHAMAWPSELPVVLVEQRLQPGVKYAAWLPVSKELLADAVAVRSVIDWAVDRWLRPWRYPDRCPLPRFDLFPRLSRLARWVRRAT